MNFWERVTRIMEQKDINKKTLAAEAGFDPSNITKGIKDNNIPSAETAVKIAKKLEVSVEYLVTGKDTIEKKPVLTVGETNPKYHSIIKDLESLSPEKKNIVFNLIEELKNI